VLVLRSAKQTATQYVGTELTLFLVLCVCVQALRVHISAATYLALSDFGLYEMTPRGTTNIKVSSSSLFPHCSL